MTSLSDHRSVAKIQALVFGSFKTGKTVGAATWPRPLIIDADRGINALTRPDVEAKYKMNANVVDFIQLKERDKSARGVPKTHNAYDEACLFFDKWVKRDADYDTWIIDTGTTLGEYAKNKAMILLGGTEFSAKPLSYTHSSAIKTGMVVMKKQDFGAERSLLEQFIDMVMDTNKHVLLLGHEYEEWEGEPPNEKMVGIVPLFTGQSRQKIPLKFDEIWNLRIQKAGEGWKRFLQTEPDGIRSCGSRLGVPNGTLFEYDAVMKSLNLSK